MRLTLRTLLAYLDDVLEPAEAQDLGARIGDSEFATNLVHRIREAMRREKLGAPRLQGKAAGLDPNTVAEYLDNTLSSERVVDFEKYCLESEVHLAETACCHQVLALVLGEPALVDPDSRRRIYGLLSQYDAKLKGGATPGAASAALAGSRFGAAAGVGAALARRRRPMGCRNRRFPRRHTASRPRRHRHHRRRPWRSANGRRCLTISVKKPWACRPGGKWRPRPSSRCCSCAR